MATMKAVGRRFNGNREHWNVADELVGQGGGPKHLSPEAEQAFLEDDITYHRDQMKLSALRLQIAGARSVQTQTMTA